VTKDVKNVAASVRQRLLNLARERNEDFGLVLTKYALERMLYRFGLHNLRHSLSSWLVNKGKAEPKTVQSLLRHSRIQTTLDLYTQGDGEETRAAQGAFLREMGVATEMIQ